jgi:hypothetical protein
MGGLRFTTPKQSGDLDGIDYTDVRVMQINWSLGADNIVCQYQLGSFDDVTGEFTPGVVSPKKYAIVNKADDLDANGDPIPGTGHTDYDDVFDNTHKTGLDTILERYLELCADKIALRLGLSGTAVKPGKGGKKKV